MLSTGGLDERGVRWNPSNSLLSRALIRLRKAGLRNMMRMAELKVRIHSPPADSPCLAGYSPPTSKAGLFPRVCGAEQVARSGETGVARSYGVDGRQYLCRAKFQYRSVDEGDGLMRRIRAKAKPSTVR